MSLYVPNDYAGPEPIFIGYLRSGLSLHLSPVYLVPPGCYVNARRVDGSLWRVSAVEWDMTLGLLATPDERKARAMLGQAKRDEARSLKKWATVPRPLNHAVGHAFK